MRRRVDITVGLERPAFSCFSKQRHDFLLRKDVEGGIRNQVKVQSNLGQVIFRSEVCSSHPWHRRLMSLGDHLLQLTWSV